MRKKSDRKKQVAKEISQAEIEKLLLKIGKLLKAKRIARTTLESFAYEIDISRSMMTRYESGHDMYLSTFLKLLHGLDIQPVEFFKEV